LVSAISKTFLVSSRLDFRAGLDIPVCFDRYFVWYGILEDGVKTATANRGFAILS
jgi:hypothetical protein